MSAEEKNIRFRFEAVSELPTVEQQLQSLIELSIKQEQIVKQQATSLQNSVASQEASLDRLNKVWKEAGSNITTVSDASKQQTAQVKASLEQQTALVKAESQKQISEAKAAEAQKTQAARAGANERTAAAKAAAEEQAVIARALADQTTAELKAELNKQTLAFKAEQEQQTTIVRGEQNRQTLLVKSELQQQTAALREQNAIVRDFKTLIMSAFGAYEIIDFGKAVIEAKTKLDTFRMGLAQMIGTKSEANKVYEDVIELAKTTPFKIESLTETTFMLKGLGVATQELIPTLTMLGNMAAVVGEDRLPRIAKAFTDVQSKGKLMKQELNQFAENGVPLYDLLAQSLGKTREEVIKMAEAHTISFDMVKKALFDASEVGGRYYNLMALQSQTLGGQVANLADKYFVAKAKIGDYFEGTIKSGIKTLNQLIDATIGSEKAIDRTVAYIKAAATAYLSWQAATRAQELATKALSIAQTAWNALTIAGTLATGTFNLALITARGTTEGLTKAQLESAVAARTLWAAMASNPIGLVVAAIGLAVTAITAYDAATAQVNDTLSEQQLKLKQEQTELQFAAQRAMEAKTGTLERKKAIESLIEKYPQYFKGLDSEKTSNSQLKMILDQVNISYRERIDLARDAYKVESLTTKQRELFEQEAALIAKLPQDVQNMIGGSLKNLLEMWQKGMISGSEAFRNESRSLMDRVLGTNRQISLETINAVVNGIEQTQSKLDDFSKKAITQKEKERIAEIGATNALYETLRQQAKGNAEKIAEINKQEKAKLAEINGEFRTNESQADDDNDKAKKKKVSQTLIEIRELKAKDGELTLEDRKKLLDLEEKYEIEKVQKSKQLVKDKLKAIDEIQAEYAPRRAALEKEIEDKKNADMLSKARETQEQIEVLTAERLEAEKILTRLQTASTEEERRAIIAEYGKKVTDEVKAQALERLRIQRDASQEILDQIRLTEGEKGDEYREAYKKALADNKAYQSALTAQTKEAAQATFQVIKETDARVAELRKQTAQQERENIEKERQFREHAIKAVIDLFGQGSPVVTQFAGAMLAAINNIDQLSGKSQKLAEDRLGQLKQTLTYLEVMQSSGLKSEEQIQKNRENIEKTKLDITKAQGLVDETKIKSFEATMGIFSMVANVAKAIADAYNQMLAETYQAIADGYQRTRDVFSEMYGLMIKMNREALSTELESFRGTYAEKEALIRQYYAEELKYAEGRDRLDAELAYAQQVAQINANSGQNIKKFMAEMVAAQYDRLAREEAMNIAKVEREIELAKELRDAKIDALQQELDAFKAAKEAESQALEEQLKRQKDATNQFYSDKELRLMEDDVYRRELLAQGEAREVAALQAAMQRELDRATSAEERTRILNAFEKLIAEKHAEYQTAIGDKTKEISLANQETKAQEADKIKQLEQETADKQKELKDQVAQKEQETTAGMIGANAEYKEFVKSAQREIFEVTKRMKIAELQAEIAILYGKRNFWNKGKINSAIDDLKAAVGEIESLTFARGTEYVDAENRFPNGVDTVPAWLDKGERILTRKQNRQLGGISNDELVNRVISFEKVTSQFQLKYPELLGPSNFGTVPTMALPAGMFNENGATGKSLSQLVSETQLMRNEFKLMRNEFARKELVKITVDKQGIGTYVEGQQSTTNYLSNLMSR
ncbi:tape measure protein [Larkinella bovis]|uniref:Tape measure protein n=1 Tax=Larkinella bovis TaxID=683041 RepID=A0ABW0IBF3_9BACT